MPWGMNGINHTWALGGWESGLGVGAWGWGLGGGVDFESEMCVRKTILKDKQKTKDIFKKPLFHIVVRSGMD